MWFPVTPGPENRWEWTPDESRHVLVLQGEIAVETHGEWIHMYTLNDGPLFRQREEGATGDLMADTMRWLATENFEALASLTDDVLWAYMETSAQNQEFAPIS